MVNLNELSKALVEGDHRTVLELTRKALSAKIPAKKILDEGLIPGIQKVGDLFGSGEYFLPELLVSGKAMSGALKILEPELARADIPSKGRFLLGTVKGDIHNIGKDIVAMMLRGNGWTVTDMGVDIPPEAFCAEVEKGNYDILGMSVLLTMTMPFAAETIEALKKAGLRDKVKIMVGGAPTTQEWADKIGADGWGSNCSEAVRVAAALM